MLHDGLELIPCHVNVAADAVRPHVYPDVLAFRVDLKLETRLIYVVVVVHNGSPPHKGRAIGRPMLVEKDVENSYRAGISKQRPTATWTSPHKTDGVAVWEGTAPATVRLLLEAKYDLDLKNRIAACGVLGQTILYLKRFEAAGDTLPNVILVGDKDECFVLATEAVRGFMNLSIDWSVAPSKGSPELTRALVDGVNILPYVYDVGGEFNFKDLVERIEVLAAGNRATVRASDANIGAIFAYWRDRVFREGKGKQAITPTEQVDVFLRSLFQPGEVYPHPAKRGVLIVPGYPDGVLVDLDQYKSFFQHFEQGYKPSEIKNFMSMKDRLVEDDARRRQGAFFTSPIWAEEAHKELDRVLGTGWRKDCVVWDPAAGTGNLTRDKHDWGCLISSTAERPDVGAMQQHGWGGKHVFQYDFLNPDAESPFFEDGAQNVIPAAVDRMLREAAKAGKRLVWFMNPPYGTAASAIKGESKQGVGQTSANESMKESRLGAASGQLYAQFLFRCRQVAEQYGFKNYTVALYSVPTFMSSGSYRPFREWWYAAHGYGGGFLFQASHFADVSGRWGVSFTVWNSGGKTDSKQDQPIRLTDERNFAVVTDGVKHVYNADDREASEWVRAPIQKSKGVDAPQMSSGLKVTDTKYGKPKKGALVYCNSLGNNLSESGTSVYFLAASSSRGQDFILTSSNWRRAVALYSARKLVGENWINQKDEYLAPDETLPGYDQWVNDCHVFAILDGANNCTAMRDVQYKGKEWRIKNNWFWRTRASALNDLDTIKTPTLYRDCEQEPTKEPSVNPITGEDETQPWEATGDAYMAFLLSSGAVALSPDAAAVLGALDALWLKSLPHREAYYAGRPVTDKEPDLHLMAWDASSYQLKNLWRDLFPTEWAELKAAHKALAARLQEGVYTFRFLKR